MSTLKDQYDHCMRRQVECEANIAHSQQVLESGLFKGTETEETIKQGIACYRRELNRQYQDGLKLWNKLHCGEFKEN